MTRSTFKTLILAPIAALALCGVAQAAIVGQSTDTTQLRVGTSTINAGPHTSGKPGVAVAGIGLSSYVDFAGLQASIPPVNGVTTINSPSSAPGSHNGMGVFNFAKVSNADLYFGEWSDTANVADGTHTVYYVGDNTGTTVPTTGSATYAVKGISGYAANGPLTGTFTANFGASTLSGSIASASTGYTVNIGSVGISGANIASTTSNATATQSTTLASGGSVSGQFFGANAAALAGLVTFGGNSQYDTAFGGTKN
ncbi:hypothetical protein PMI01_00025 [Caulobacter sp. AP07]|uniref:Slam-dependent surface lipoprotein n=1 Tax=Caulobacter sp. AP07 TaxID=1144304 RepID=UPI000271E32D|nr:Slam-dependent surface lipoprotein [Caulobacter sp. AP07]EJL38458.1 hypothetical protein PMI01_00025 [Caulobacter sp. AP07]